jgi:hypothetical protein
LCSTGDDVWLDPSSIRVDAMLFEQAADSDDGADLERAAQIYQGDLLDGMAVTASPFDELRRGFQDVVRWHYHAFLASLGSGPLVGMQDTFDLGTLPAGADFTLTYLIEARAYTGSLNTVIIPNPDSTTVSLSALIEDPFSLDSGFFLNGRSFASLTATDSGPDDSPASGVPAPAAWLLLSAGLLAPAAARRRER